MGEFQGDEDAWMEKYFDAFIYLANWGTHTFKSAYRAAYSTRPLRSSTASANARSFTRRTGTSSFLLFPRMKKGAAGLTATSTSRPSFPSAPSLRAGDVRGLYLGWLLCAQSGDLSDDEVEPPVPPGLGQLSAGLEYMADFLRIDTDLIHVAAQASAPLEDKPTYAEVLAWVAKLPSAQKDDVIARLITTDDAALPIELMRRFLEEGLGGRRTAESSGGRTVGALREATETFAEERRKSDAKKAAEKKARHEREAAIARTKYLDGLSHKEPLVWRDIEVLLATKQGKSYEQAVQLLVDLRDLAVRNGGSDFRARLDSLRTSHASKPRSSND